MIETVACPTCRRPLRVPDTLLAIAAQIERIYEIVERGKLPRNRISVGESHCNTGIAVLLVDNNRH